MTPPDTTGPVETVPLPPGLTEIQFVDSLLEMARQFLASDDTRDIERALGLIAAARERLAAAAKAAP